MLPEEDNEPFYSIDSSDEYCSSDVDTSNSNSEEYESLLSTRQRKNSILSLREPNFRRQ